MRALDCAEVNQIADFVDDSSRSIVR